MSRTRRFSHRGSHVYGTRHPWGGQGFHACFDSRQHPCSGRRFWVPSESLLRRHRTMGLGKLTQDLASLTRGKAKIMAKSPRLSCANKQKGPFLLDPLLAVFGHTHEHTHVCECVCTHKNPFASPKRNNHERSTQFVFVGCNAFSPESHLTSR